MEKHEQCPCCGGSGYNVVYRVPAEYRPVEQNKGLEIHDLLKTEVPCACCNKKEGGANMKSKGSEHFKKAVESANERIIKMLQETFTKLNQKMLEAIRRHDKTAAEKIERKCAAETLPGDLRQKLPGILERIYIEKFNDHNIMFMDGVPIFYFEAPEVEYKNTSIEVKLNYHILSQEGRDN